AFGLVGGAEDALLRALAAILFDGQVAEEAEGQRRLGGGAGLGDDVDRELLALAPPDKLIVVGLADAVARKIDLRPVPQIVVELGMQELDCRPRAQIAAADADDNQNLRVAADLLRRL